MKNLTNKLLISLSLLSLLASCNPPVEKIVDNANDKSDSSSGANSIGNCDLAKLKLDPLLGAPQTVEDAIDLINALPKPVTIPCFVQALQRPLRINATSSILSAQPAAGENNPRLFIFSGPDLIISIVSDGSGQKLMEFSQLLNDAQSIKGELKFPIFDKIAYSLPFTRILSGNQTVCSACHIGETRDPAHPNTEVYISPALKPKANKIVYLSDFWQEYYNCELQNDTSDRCLMIISIFSYGDVKQQDFPVGMPTFFRSLGFQN